MGSLSGYYALIRRSLLGLSGLLISSAMVVFLISPRRDPTFIPTSSNAGSMAPWAATIPESVWTSSIAIFAILLAIHVVLLTLGRPSLRRLILHRDQFILMRRAIIAVGAVLFCVGLAFTLWFGMLWYLLAQSIVD